MLDWWRGERNGSALPPASAVDPTRIPTAALPHVAVLDPPDADNRILVRLTGSQLDLEIGINVTGMYLDEFTSGHMLSYLSDLYTTVVRKAAPVYSTGKIMLPNRNLMLTRRLYLPFGTAKVEKLVACQTFKWVHHRDAGAYALVRNGDSVVDHEEFILETGWVANGA